ncbi:MAG TPA: glycosyltransferase [Kofleriaceae bacterium]|nr:glycosyltransferase [Kofleriaceae bacterium]
MKVVVTAEYHYLATDDGVMVDGKCDYAYWAQLLDVFDEVGVFSRLVPGEPSPSARPVEGPGVRLLAAPDFVATRGLFRAAPGLARAAWRAAGEGDAFLLHAPGVMASALRPAIAVRRKPYAVEVVGDPSRSLDGAGRALTALRGLAGRDLASMVAGAAATRYVTRRHLQERYPPRAGTPSFVVSDAFIPDEIFHRAPATIRDEPVLALGFVGALHRPYKALDVLLDALARTTRPHTLDVVGDGALRPSLEEQAARLGLGPRVRFLGALPSGAPVYDFLRGRSALVQPSRTEGLPRSLLEGMALGLPCLATPVGGLPELLGADELVPVDDAGALARAIDALGADAPRRRRLALANRDLAREYAAGVSRMTMRHFHQALRDAAAG